MSTGTSVLIEKQKARTPAFHLAVAAVVAILILSLWLHFLLALEIENIGRDIDVRTAELERLQRQNLATLGQIALLESQERMAGKAKTMGFLPQEPLYLAVNEPPAPSSSRTWDSTFMSIWLFGAGKEAAAARAAEERPNEMITPAANVANLP